MPTVYVTAPSEDAERLAELVVESRLAACVNRVPTQSTYRWDGEIHHDEETILLIKTTGERYDELVSRLLEEHPHDVPCIERFDADDIEEAFGQWITDVTDAR